MSFHFHFRGLEDIKDLTNLIDFLALQNLGYPNYDEWMQRTEHELDIGYKHAILAFSENFLVGDLVYQQHKENFRFLELKNLRINSAFQMRDFAGFMLKQVEVDSRENYDAIICDAPVNQPDITDFMESKGYIPFLKLPLYTQNSPDLAMIKFLNQSKKELILPIAKKIIYNKAI